MAASMRFSSVTLIIVLIYIIPQFNRNKTSYINTILKISNIFSEIIR